MSFKRKRGGENPIMKAAQMGGDPARSAFVKDLISKNPSSGRRIAQSSLAMPQGRSGIRHIMKSETTKGMVASRNKLHVHDVMRKYYRGKTSNGIKAHISTYAG